LHFRAVEQRSCPNLVAFGTPARNPARPDRAHLDLSACCPVRGSILLFVSQPRRPGAGLAAFAPVGAASAFTMAAVRVTNFGRVLAAVLMFAGGKWLLASAA